MANRKATSITEIGTILITMLTGNVFLIEAFSTPSTNKQEAETITTTPNTNTRVVYDYDYPDYYGDEYIYPGYSFERKVYLCIWEILVILACLVNILVISVLLRRKLRSVTNVILSAIAVSDSLTGLVTLPAYIMVYERHDPSSDESYYITYSTRTQTTNAMTETANVTHEPPVTEFYYTDTIKPAVFDSYVLPKTLCNAFMISKYFLSKSFHTVSVFLTLFLGVQRYVAIAYPFTARLSIKKTIICCLGIFVVSPILHGYHLNKEKAVDGLCQWELSGTGCKFDCIYEWAQFFIRHFLPCAILSIVTALFIKKLRSGETTICEMNSYALSERIKQNRHVTKTVVAVVIGFLTPEIPYGFFLLYNAIGKTIHQEITLEKNRMIHMCFEILLVLSFHVNFYIYTFFNRRFRNSLFKTVIKCSLPQQVTASSFDQITVRSPDTPVSMAHIS